MEGQQQWRPRLSFRSATIMMCLLNVITALLLLQGFLSSASSRSKSSPSSATLRYIRESEEIRLAMQPSELIKRVHEKRKATRWKHDLGRKKNFEQAKTVFCKGQILKVGRDSWWHRCCPVFVASSCSFGLLMSTLFYIASMCGIALMYSSYAMKSSCDWNKSLY